MIIGKSTNPTDFARYFLEPSNSTHRQYEALRAYFVDGLGNKEAAQRFGFSEGSFRVLVHHFRQNPERQFFLPPGKGQQSAPGAGPVREPVIAPRTQNLSIYDNSRTLKTMSHSLNPISVSKMIKQEGFARLPRRIAGERPQRPQPIHAEPADVRMLDLSPRTFYTKFGGLFLFMPLLARIPLDRIVKEIDFPSSIMIPAGHAMRSLLALKLFGSARHRHVMSYVLDEGLALFTGLNIIPKRAFLTEYSCRVDPQTIPKLMTRWFDAVAAIGMEQGASFDLDFRTIPFHGEEAFTGIHNVSKRSRRQKGILAFVAQDASRCIFCYANGEVRRDTRNDEIIRFVEYWIDRTGRQPEELIFDSKLTTYRNLNHLNQHSIKFITLRRRSCKMLQDVSMLPIAAWKKIEIEGVSRIYKNPRILDSSAELKHYNGHIRQIVITGSGYENPTFLLTNYLKKSPSRLIERYIQRMITENNIDDGIDFFHVDALSSAVAMKMDLDLQLTLMASSLYRLFAQQIGQGYEKSGSSD